MNSDVNGYTKTLHHREMLSVFLHLVCQGGRFTSLVPRQTNYMGC